jgi:tetratricopeptide (TPR) repeat protein
MGVALGRQGRWNDAIYHHEQACKYDPGNKEFRINLSAARCSYGQQRLATKDYSGAAHLFRKALTAANDNALADKLLKETIKRMGLDPNDAANRLGMGDELSASGDIDGAMVEYKEAMKLDPGAKTYTKMGDMALRYQQVGNAISWYRQAITKDTEYGPAHRQLGLMYLAQKDYTSAAAELRKAVILNPADVAAGQNLVELWRKQVAANPGLSENRLGLAGALQLTGDVSGAEGEYKTAEQLDPNNPKLEAGRASLARAIKHMSAEKHKAAADTFLSQGLGRDALAEISQAVMIEPRNAKYQFLFGEALSKSGDYEAAMEAYRKSVLIDPQNSQEAAFRLKELEERTASAPRRSQQQAQQPQQQQVGLSRDKLFEGQNQNQNQAAAGQAPYTGGFRTHDENGGAGSAQLNVPRSSIPQNYNANTQAYSPAHSPDQSPVNSAAQSQSPGAANSAAKSIDQATQNYLRQCEELEMKRDFQGAVTLLRQALNDNLQNSEIHHRLAVNLLNLGQITESVSEFRIASALKPTDKTYADDLARALNIHKRSLMSDSTGNTAQNQAQSQGGQEQK